ncbi:disintegrin and metalloproteinase domain-containing protein 10-like [Bolinopsis microptera]|uniref:disintegrin and metalloproteinase domain-containing protein 10-like n=1 Tax=Bolinopsis microptera TaxID=2820187 RepID=UPI00307A032C
MSPVSTLLLFALSSVFGNKLNDRISEWWPVKQTLKTHLSSETVSVTLLGNLRLITLDLHNTADVGWGETLLSGQVKGDKTSSATGYLDEDDKFVGRVHLKGILYHVEPALRHNLPGSEYDSVMYRGSQEPILHSQLVRTLQPPRSGGADKTARADKSARADKTARAKRAVYNYKRKSLDSLKNRTCAVLLAADHLFFEHIGKGSRATTTKELLLHLYEANKIYRSTDFDFDGRSDNIGFAVGNVTIFQHENMAENKFFGEIKSSSDYLVRWSEYDHSSYCLALCFTYRDFESGVLGLAYVGAKDRTGGICDQRYSMNGHKASFNTGIVSMMNFGAYVGHDVSFIILSHELGHNFGASHDSDTKLCTPGSEHGGNYIMYDKATNGDLPHNNLLSLCSRQAILDVLLTRSKTSCFREADSYCGNGIKEWDEECDCGHNSTCQDIDPCCTPADSTTGTPCTVRRHQGFLCSPVDGDCCTSSCSFSSNKTVCKEDGECSELVLCRYPFDN